MKKRMALTLLLAATVITSSAQYRYDNALYQLVYLEDLCKTFENNPGYFLLDVRTKGEYDDTSTRGLNIGRFKTAYNIPIQELGKRISEIGDYKSKPVFVYCSHSQRSRRASKMLADSGFTKIFNINSGLSQVYHAPKVSLSCLFEKIESKKTYSLLSPQDLCTKLSAKKANLLILDVSPDSIFNRSTHNEKLNRMPTIKGTKHISFTDLEKNINGIPPADEIIIFDPFGDDAAKAARLLSQKNIKNIYVLFDGVESLPVDLQSNQTCLNTFIIQTAPYRIMSNMEFVNTVQQSENILILDIRAREEFENKAQESYKNIGHLQGAKNIPLPELDPNSADLTAFKNKPVILYDFSGNQMVYQAAKKLTDAGFRNVSLLAHGLFNLRWTSHNEKGMQNLESFVTDIPDINK